ncbi:MFS general substrate transporter [Hymenopellis radicata]|nr:MFS general substrate transporter [Hymenopellis radicata]
MCRKIQYMDKATLGNAAALNLREDTHLSTDELMCSCTRLGTVFYLSYLVFEFPQNLALQRFPVGKWLSINIFVWAVALCCHAACKNFAGLMIVRLILGMCEGSITSGFMIVSSMFYTRSEQTLRVGYWCKLPTTAQIISGFISFGTLHMKAVELAAWQWLFIIMGAITVVTAIAFWFLFPDSPTTAWFLTQEERAQAVQRIKENQTGVENKHFKREQMIEAFTDPKIWLFALFSVLTNIPNSLSNQRQIIILSFGFNQLQTTLLGCVDGIVEIITIWTGTAVASRIPNSRGYVAAAWMTPNLLAVFLINFLPWDNKVGLLISLFISGVGTTAFVISLSWISSVTAGHTKRITVNTIMLSAYCVGNAVGPFMWREQYKPRNHVPWAVIGVCIVCRIILMLTIRIYLFFENKRRDREERDTTYDEVYIDVTKDGVTKKVRLDKEYLDLTDIQNRDFRYVL